MAMIENLQGVLNSYVKPNFNQALNFVETRVNQLRTHLIPRTENPTTFQSVLQHLESAAASNKHTFKVILGGTIGFAAYWLKEQIPTIPAYLFIGAAAGYTIHENLKEIGHEIREKFSNGNRVKFAISTLASLAALYGSYVILNKFSIMEAAQRTVITTAVTALGLEILKRFGNSPNSLRQSAEELPGETHGSQPQSAEEFPDEGHESQHNSEEITSAFRDWGNALQDLKDFCDNK